MPKTPSKKLFDLVKSLSPAEKRYFKVFATKKNESKNKYIALFDAIEIQKTFDDEALIKTIYGDEEIQSRKYSELKAYLFDLILKCLQAYDEKSSVVTRISNMLGNVQVLFKRGHFADCKDVLKKTKKIALKYEEFSQLYEILQCEKWLAHTTINVDFLDNQLGRIEEEEKGYLEQLNNLASYRNLFLKLYLSIKKNAANETLFQEIESSNLLKKKVFKSHRAKVLYYRVQSLLAYAKENIQEFYEFNKELILEMESQPHFLDQNASEYISALSNYCMSCKLTKHYAELDVALEKFRLIKTLNYDDELKVHRQYYQILFSMCISNGAFEKARIALKDHLQKVEKFDAKLFERKSFYFYYSYIYFGCADYEQSLVYLNEWLDLPKTVERPYYKMLARIFNLVLHYEMKNNILLESLLRSTYRFLKKENQLHEIERAFLTFIRNSLKVANKSELKDQLLQLRTSLESINDGKPARIGQFDLSAWVESKIENKPFAEVVQRRFVSTI